MVITWEEIGWLSLFSLSSVWIDTLFRHVFLKHTFFAAGGVAVRIVESVSGAIVLLFSSACAALLYALLMPKIGSYVLEFLCLRTFFLLGFLRGFYKDRSQIERLAAWLGTACIGGGILVYAPYIMWAYKTVALAFVFLLVAYSDALLIKNISGGSISRTFFVRRGAHVYQAGAAWMWVSVFDLAHAWGIAYITAGLVFGYIMPVAQSWQRIVCRLCVVCCGVGGLMIVVAGFSLLRMSMT